MQCSLLTAGVGVRNNRLSVQLQPDIFQHEGGVIDHGYEHLQLLAMRVEELLFQNLEVPVDLQNLFF